VGQCAALNVPQWEPRQIRRGDVVTIRDYFAPQQWYLCDLKLLDQERNDLKNGSQVKFHTGTSETVAAVYLFQEARLRPGQECLVQVRLSEPVIAGPRDRFILRAPSPARTIGGGIVVEALPKRLKRSHPEVLADIGARARAVRRTRDFVEYCVKSAEHGAADEKALSRRSKIPRGRLPEMLAGLCAEGRVVKLGAKRYIHIDTAERLQRRLLDAIAGFHRQQPESPGVTGAHLLTESGLGKDLFDGLIERMHAQGALAQRKGCLALPGHREQFNDAEQELLAKIESLFRDQPFAPALPTEVAGAVREPAAEVDRVLRILVEQQRLVRIDQKLLFHAEAIAVARARLVAHIREHGQLESVKFKYLLDTTRKYAIPLLDYFDKIGVTRRVGNTRYLSKVGESA